MMAWRSGGAGIVFAIVVNIIAITRNSRIVGKRGAREKTSKKVWNSNASIITTYLLNKKKKGEKGHRLIPNIDDTV